MKIEFSEMCVPPKTFHHAKRIVRMGAFAQLADKPELVAAKNFWDTLLIAHRPEKPLKGPLLLHVDVVWPWNTSDTKTMRAKGRIYHSTKPDTSNIAKTLEDSMGRCGFFVNDSQIARSTICKFRGEVPGIYVRLVELEG